MTPALMAEVVMVAGKRWGKMFELGDCHTVVLHIHDNCGANYGHPRQAVGAKFWPSAHMLFPLLDQVHKFAPS